MAWYHRKKLAETSDNIHDSMKQLEIYLSESHVVKEDYFPSLKQQASSINIPEEITKLENSANIVEEMKRWLDLEAKRRLTSAKLNEKEKKGVIKKARQMRRITQLEAASCPYNRPRTPPPAPPARNRRTSRSMDGKYILSILHIRRYVQEKYILDILSIFFCISLYSGA